RGFRYVREDRPGLDWARNRGIAEARHDLIAFTDDDATVCRNWLRAMARAFADEEVMGVTGLVLPAELETPSQMWFQRYGGMGKGFAARRFCGVSIGPREMMAAQEVGVGANMVFRRCVFHKIGGFDTRLDVGTPSRGGGDLDIFHRVLSAGLTIHYEPAAFAWHRDRRDMNGLRTQIYNNGCSYGVYLLKVLRNGSVPRLEAMDYAFRWAAGWVLWRFLRGLTRPRYFPLGLLGAELRGALHAPAAYRASARQDCLVRAAGSLSKNPEDGKPHA
ncbi:MAG: glycosyltransferase, partial [Acidobacteria bacterium]|nr:glycosyltransferase [Acidobacteriota bacterium]